MNTAAKYAPRHKRKRGVVEPMVIIRFFMVLGSVMIVVGVYLHYVKGW